MAVHCRTVNSDCQAPAGHWQLSVISNRSPSQDSGTPGWSEPALTIALKA